MRCTWPWQCWGSSSPPRCACLDSTSLKSSSAAAPSRPTLSSSTPSPPSRRMQYHQTAVVPRESILRAEAEWLTSIKADLVVSDVVLVACRVAADAGIRSVCIGNFR